MCVQVRDEAETIRPPSYSSGDHQPNRNSQQLPPFQKPKPEPAAEVLSERQTARSLPPIGTLQMSAAGAVRTIEQTQQQQERSRQRNSKYELLEGQQMYGRPPRWQPASTRRPNNRAMTADWPDEWFENQTGSQ